MDRGTDPSYLHTNTTHKTHHTAARAREDARDGLDVSEAVLGLGGGDERDQARRARERQQERQAQRAGERER